MKEKSVMANITVKFNKVGMAAFVFGPVSQ